MLESQLPVVLQAGLLLRLMSSRFMVIKIRVWICPKTPRGLPRGVFIVKV
jgi:hypothetical protein